MQWELEKQDTLSRRIAVCGLLAYKKDEKNS